jgi:hypothetical protein
MALSATVITHHQERLHFILQHDRQFVHVTHRGVTSSRHTAVLLDCLKDLPPLLTILRVAREAEGEEEGLDSLRPKDVARV